jgi:hypothetical protein
MKDLFIGKTYMGKHEFLYRWLSFVPAMFLFAVILDSFGICGWITGAIAGALLAISDICWPWMIRTSLHVIGWFKHIFRKNEGG